VTVAHRRTVPSVYECGVVYGASGTDALFDLHRSEIIFDDAPWHE
jgi:hypothetical protein